MVDIDVGDSGFGHIFRAVGAGRVGDEQVGSVCFVRALHGFDQAGCLGVDGAAGVADFCVCTDFFSDAFRPVIDFGNCESVRCAQGRCDLVGRVRAAGDDIDGGLCVGEGIV